MIACPACGEGVGVRGGARRHIRKCDAIERCPYCGDSWPCRSKGCQGEQGDLREAPRIPRILHEWFAPSDPQWRLRRNRNAGGSKAQRTALARVLHELALRHPSIAERMQSDAFRGS